MPLRLDHQPAGAPLSDPEADELARAMAAFATPSRLKLLFALIGVERTVEALARATGLGETVVSQQLRVLRLLRFVAGRREGRHVRYRLFDDHVAELLAAVRHHGEHAAGAPAAEAARNGAGRTGQDER
jgi:ArsR family transcriptional regulator, nickel/cobalt-responsive transcriptional repressor